MQSEPPNPPEGGLIAKKIEVPLRGIRGAEEKFLNRTGDRAELPSPAIVERYMRGEYGEKAGKGWYDHKAEKKK